MWTRRCSDHIAKYNRFRSCTLPFHRGCSLTGERASNSFPAVHKADARSRAFPDANLSRHDSDSATAVA